jgi:hypothetical protein
MGLPFALGVIGLLTDTPVAAQIATVWKIAHIAWTGRLAMAEVRDASRTRTSSACKYGAAATETGKLAG